MITAADIDSDWQYFANVRKVSYYPFLPATETYGDPIHDVDAFPTGTVKQERPTADGGALFTEECTYHLRMAHMQGTEPTKRGKIVDDTAGKTWIILGTVEIQSFGTRARCKVTRE